MAILDVESFVFSNNFQDYITYGRFLQWFSFGEGGKVNIGTITNQILNDPALLLTGYFGSGRCTWVAAQRRAVPGGALQAGGMCIRLLVPFDTFYQIKWIDLQNNLVQATLSFNGCDGSIAVYQGDSVGYNGNPGFNMQGGPVIFNTAPQQFPLGKLFHAEVQIVIGSGNAGAIALRLFGKNLIFNLSGINTQYSGRNAYDTTSIFFGTPNSLISQTCQVPAQHLIWYDLPGAVNINWLGDNRVFGGIPVADGDQTHFTPVGAQSNWQNVANSPINPADYNLGNANGAVDLYKISAPQNTTQVAGVMVSAVTQKAGGGAQTASLLLKSNGTVGAGPAVPLADSFTTQSNVWLVDPSTGLPFTPAALQTLQAGLEVGA